MFANVTQVKDFINQKTIQMIDLKFCDLWGRWHHVTIPATSLDERLLEEGGRI